MDDKAPSTPKADASSVEEGRAASPRSGFASQAKESCSALSRLTWELWRRIRLEVVVEWPLLKQRWKILLFGLVMQYVHGIFTQLAHRMHQPQEEPLHDVGFDLTPELGADQHWVSETIFGIAFATFVLWTFTPFVTQRKRFYTAVMWSRLLMVLVVCQALRIVTFSVTQLPGPSFHCRASEPTARREWPSHWTGHVYIDVGRQMSKSCGDLIFSSHTTFMLTGILAYNEYGSLAFMKALSWLLGVIISILIVASRKHYTVDIVIAWYTVPLVFYTMYRRWTTRRPMSDFIGGSALSAFDDVDGGELELEEVLIDRGVGGMEAGGKAAALGGAQPRPNTLKISVRSSQDGRHLMGMGLTLHAKDVDTSSSGKGEAGMARSGAGQTGQGARGAGARPDASEGAASAGATAQMDDGSQQERRAQGGQASSTGSWFFSPRS
ncbi:hypothetical protein HXX76_010990 [Chlamydomonas incerta]|uniref:Sphingomyelin synthase-like domain-containing protein n=1 Tax=Chlamydomonas incerta TaxID=51695 RepID=A0A835VVA9_CHLIN|nr:hypothetical protein HXX76_010990 [Chlamydomonas incerta]|eukprot:KAG2429220.1 hypothetical protein HXX76_010990 [Chlamydomonas incerta]